MRRRNPQERLSPPEDLVELVYATMAEKAAERGLSLPGGTVPPWEPYGKVAPPQGVTYFASAANHPGEIQGFADIGIPPGVAANECAALDPAGKPRECELALLSLAGKGVPVFIDSGAVSERGGPKVSDSEWARRFRFYERVAKALPGNAYLVAPDKVGDQKESLRRIKKFAALFRKLARAPYRARILVPLQLGGKRPSVFLAEAERALGPGVTPAIPWRPEAGWDLDSLEEFLSERGRGLKSIHMLGLGPGGRSWRQVMALIRRYSPRAEVSWDASLTARARGWGQEKFDPKAYTYAQEIAAELLEASVRNASGRLEQWEKGLGWVSPDETEAMLDVNDWLTKKQSRALARGWELTPADSRRFAADPYEWLQSGDPPRYELPWIHHDLELAWVEHLRDSIRFAAGRKRYAIHYAFAQKAAGVGQGDPDLRRLVQAVLFPLEQGLLFE